MVVVVMTGERGHGLGVLHPDRAEGSLAPPAGDQGRDFTATWPETEQVAQTTPGAIYQQGTEVRLWQNVTARNVGDTLTIRLEESTNAEKSVTTNTSKTSEATMTGPTIFGRPVTVNGVPVLEGSMNNDSSFNGNGASKQSNALDGALSVTVAKRLRQRQPAGARREVDRDQLRQGIRAHAGHRASLGHRARQLGGLLEGRRRLHLLWRPGHGGECQQTGLVLSLLQFTAHTVSEDSHASPPAVPPLRNPQRVRRHLRRVVPAAVAMTAQAERVKDLASVQGVRNNQLVGYGLVVGLDGTGDQTSQTPFTLQSIKNMLIRYGVTIPPGTNPQLKNVAAVTVHADLPPFAKPGQNDRRHRVLDRQRRHACVVVV